MKRKMSAGLTSATIPIFIADTSSTTGAGLSGLTSGTSGLVCEYRRQAQNAWTAVTLSAGTLGTWSSGGFVADGALAGCYELGLPDASVASGARWVAVRLRGAANMLACLIEIELDAINYQDAVRFGLTALPNANVSGVGGLLTAPTAANTGIASIATGGIAAISFAAGAIDAAAIATDAIGANEISAAAVTKIQTGLATTGAAMTLTSGERTAIADATLGRSVATVESTAAEWSLASMILAAFESSVTGTTWTIKRTDGTTVHLTKTVTTNAAADPITGVS